MSYGGGGVSPPVKCGIDENLLSCLDNTVSVPSPRLCNSAVQLSSRLGNCPAQCLPPKPSLTTSETSGLEPQR